MLGCQHGCVGNRKVIGAASDNRTLPFLSCLHRSYAYLEAAADVAREQWTQFDDVSMAAGLALLAAALVLHAAAAFGPTAAGGSGMAAGQRQTRASSRSKQANGEPAGGDSAPAGWLTAVGQQVAAWRLAARWQAGSCVWMPTLRAWLAALALVHALGIFSFFYLLSEGTWQCWFCRGFQVACHAASCCCSSQQKARLPAAQYVSIHLPSPAPQAAM